MKMRKLAAFLCAAGVLSSLLSAGAVFHSGVLVDDGVDHYEGEEETLFYTDEELLQEYGALKERFNVCGYNSYVIGAVKGEIIDNQILSDNVDRVLRGEPVENYNGYLLSPEDYSRITPMTLDGFVITERNDGMLALYDLKCQEFVVEYGTGLELSSSGAEFDRSPSYDWSTRDGVLRKLDDGTHLLALRDLATKKCGYVDLYTGQVKIPFQYEQAKQFSEGLACVKQDGKWGCIDAGGQVVIGFQYDRMSGFQNGLCQANGLGTMDAQLIDTAGNTVIRTNSQQVYLVGEDYYLSRSQFFEMAATGSSTPGRGSVDAFEIFDRTGAKLAQKDFNDQRLSVNEVVSEVDYEGAGRFLFRLARGETELLDVSSLRPQTPAQDAGVEGVYNGSVVLINGAPVAMDAYTIRENNYFKLRDLAMALSGTEKQFEVRWDGVNNAILMESGAPYTPVGGELALSRGGDLVTAVPSASQLRLNGGAVSPAAYTIGQNNYFKLRDIGKLLDFSVEWDGDADIISIDTSMPYTE